eukprot:2456441-Pyramimonas_sp.AAC.1
MCIRDSDLCAINLFGRTVELHDRDGACDPLLAVLDDRGRVSAHVVPQAIGGQVAWADVRAAWQQDV